MTKPLIRLCAVVGWATATVCGAQTLKQMQVGNPAYNFNYYSNKTVTGVMSDITRVVIIQHGINRDGNVAFTDMNNALKNSGASTANVLIVAPQFWNDVDKSAGKVPVNTPYWYDEDWSLGFDSTNDARSSFTVIDDVVKKLTDSGNFPNVTQIVIAGHSAGGQMYSRYAAYNTVHNTVSERVNVRYAIANPGTHLYFTSDRATASVPDGGTNFAHYSGPCAGFDAYKYGSASYPTNFTYPHTLSGADRFKRFAGRTTYYYQGDADKTPSSESNGPDNECGAVLSGDTRFARGITNKNYQNFMAAQHGVSLRRTFRRVNGVGHSGGKMWNSVCAMTAIFGVAQQVNSTGATCQEL